MRLSCEKLFLVYIFHRFSNDLLNTSYIPPHFHLKASTSLCTGLFEMIVGVLTTCHTQYSWDRSLCVFYLIEQRSTFLLHTSQVLCMCDVCDSTNINTIMKCKYTKRLLTAVRHLSKLRSKRRNAQLLHTAHHKRKLWEFLEPSVQLNTPISSAVGMSCC